METMLRQSIALGLMLGGAIVVVTTGSPMAILGGCVSMAGTGFLFWNFLAGWHRETNWWGYDDEEAKAPEESTQNRSPE